MSITPEQEAELRRLQALAPPGEYVPDIDAPDEDYGGWTGKVYAGMNHGADGVAICMYNDDPGTKKLVAYLCAAGTAVPGLLEALDAERHARKVEEARAKYWRAIADLRGMPGKVESTRVQLDDQATAAFEELRSLGAGIRS